MLAEEAMQKMYPDIRDTKEGPEAVMQHLAAVLPPVWDTLKLEYLENLLRSMPSLVSAVIAANGWFTKY